MAQAQETPQTDEHSQVPDIEPATTTDDTPTESHDDNVDLTKEPGGDSPENVYARRRARELRQTREALERERLDKARLEERARLLEEQLQKRPAAEPDPKQRVFTIAEVNAAVEAGQISRADGDKYIEEVIVPKRLERMLDEREAQRAQKAPLEKALDQIKEYRQVLPTLDDRTHPDNVKVADEYRSLIGRGLPDNTVTLALAVERVHGNLDTLKKKVEVARASSSPRTMPSDAGSGGGTQTRNNGTVDLAKAPEFMTHVWEKTGTSVEDRKRELADYLNDPRRQRK